MPTDEQQELDNLIDRLSIGFPIDITDADKSLVTDAFTSRFPERLALEAQKGLNIEESIQHFYWTIPEYFDENADALEGEPDLTKQRMAVLFRENGGSITTETAWVAPICTELLSNCHRAGATHALVELDLEKRTLSVKDDVTHASDELPDLLLKLNSQEVRTTKTAEGGMGIKSIRQTMEQQKGALRYTESEGHIVAVISWEQH